MIQKERLSSNFFGNTTGKRGAATEHRDTLMRLAKLKETTELELMVYNSEGLKEFLETPLPVFGGRCAFDLLVLGDYEPVISALASDFEGTGF